MAYLGVRGISLEVTRTSPQPSVEIGTTQKEATLWAHQFATVISQLRRAIWADLHHFTRRQRLIGC